MRSRRFDFLLLLTYVMVDILKVTGHTIILHCSGRRNAVTWDRLNSLLTLLYHLIDNTIIFVVFLPFHLLKQIFLVRYRLIGAWARSLRMLINGLSLTLLKPFLRIRKTRSTSNMINFHKYNIIRPLVSLICRFDNRLRDIISPNRRLFLDIFLNNFKFQMPINFFLSDNLSMIGNTVPNFRHFIRFFDCNILFFHFLRSINVLDRIQLGFFPSGNV